MHENKDSDHHVHTFEFDGDPEVRLTWEEIESRCHGLWQIPSNDSSDDDPEDLRQTYANIRKRVIESNQPSTDADNEFSWLKPFIKPEDSGKAVHSSARYGVPMHITGDPESANLIVCMTNPNVAKGIAENARIETVMSKEDLLISETPGTPSYRPYHPKENVFSLYWRLFSSSTNDSQYGLDDTLRESAISSFYYYLYKYYTHVAHHLKECPEENHSVHLTYFEDPREGGTYKKRSAKITLPPIKFVPDILNISQNTDYLGAQHLEKLVKAPICNIELFPFRSRKSYQVEKSFINYERIQRLSVAVMVRRILDFVEDYLAAKQDNFKHGKPTPPIIVLARRETKWLLGPRNLFDQFFAKAVIYIEGEKVDTAGQFLRALANFDGGENIFFCLSSPDSGSLSHNNLVEFMPSSDTTQGQKQVVHKKDINGKKVKIDCVTHQRLFGKALEVDLSTGD